MFERIELKLGGIIFFIGGATKKDVMEAVRNYISSKRKMDRPGKTKLEAPAVFAYYH